jgi:hypothetical protein
MIPPTVIEKTHEGHFLATAGKGNWIQALVDREGNVNIWQQSDRHSAILNKDQTRIFAEWLLESSRSDSHIRRVDVGVTVSEDEDEDGAASEAAWWIERQWRWEQAKRADKRRLLDQGAKQPE